MHINTKSVFKWDKVLKKYVEIHNEGFEYEGKMELLDSHQGPGGGGPPGGGVCDKWFYYDCGLPDAPNYNPDCIADPCCTVDNSYCWEETQNYCLDQSANNYGDLLPCTYSGAEEEELIYGYNDPEATNYDPGAVNDDGSCIYTDISDDDISDDDWTAQYGEETAASCTPGTMYYDWERNLKYCPGGSGLYGDPLGEWQAGGGVNWATGIEDPEGYGLYEVAGEQRNIFDVLPPEFLQHVPPQYWGNIGGSYAGLEERPLWESFRGDIRGLQAGTRTERRSAQEAAREMNLYGGVSQTFAGGGGGVMPGRERAGAMSTFRDFLGEQATERTGYELGFGEEATGLREQWEEDIQTRYGDVLAGEPTEYCTTCESGFICMGKDASGNDICEDMGSFTEEDWLNIQNTWLG